MRQLSDLAAVKPRVRCRVFNFNRVGDSSELRKKCEWVWRERLERIDPVSSGRHTRSLDDRAAVVTYVRIGLVCKEDRVMIRIAYAIDSHLLILCHLKCVVLSHPLFLNSQPPPLIPSVLFASWLLNKSNSQSSLT